MKPTDVQIIDIIRRHQPGDTYGTMIATIRACLALAAEPEPVSREEFNRVVAQRQVAKEKVRQLTAQVVKLLASAEPEPPVTVDRTGHWFKSAGDGEICGPIVETRGHDHLLQRHVDGGSGVLACAFTEGNVASGRVLRIPPPPEGVVDLEGWECREPEKDERWYEYMPGQPGAKELLDGSYTPFNDPKMGKRRWCPPKPVAPALKPWLTGPFEVRQNATQFSVWSADWGYVAAHCSKDNAEAIKLSLDMLPECVASMQDEAMVHPANYCHCGQAGKARRQKRDAQLAKIAKAGFDLTAE